MDYVTFPFEKFVSCITTEYDVQADSILALYIEIAKYLRDNPIVSGLTVKEIIDKYLEENPPTVGVVSVNGKTGVVTGLYDEENPPPYPVTSVNGKTGAVTGLYDAENQPPYPVTSVNGQTGEVIIQEGGGTSGVTSVNGKTGVVTGLYDAENPPPYPVTSVNNKTGEINIKTVDVTNGITPDSDTYIFIDESEEYTDDSDTGWVDLALEEGFQVYGTGQQPRYRKIGNIVTLIGAVKPSAIIAGGTSSNTFTILPEKCRPVMSVVVMCQGSGSNKWALEIKTNGEVGVSRYGVSSIIDIPAGTWLPFYATFIVGG